MSGPVAAPALNTSHYHECAVCDATLVCCCPDRRQVDRLTGKPRRLLCVACGEIAEGMRELDAEAAGEGKLDAGDTKAARQPL